MMPDLTRQPDSTPAAHEQPPGVPAQRRQFVILLHDHPFEHWDFLIEDGETLASWRLLQPPKSGRCVDATPMPPHRRHYLTWEGPVSSNRGQVRRLHAGYLQTNDAWPGVDEWAGLWLQITGCDVADRCRLLTNSDQQTQWEFS